MSDSDDRIRTALARQASSLHEQPNLPALTERIAHIDRRRLRAASAAAVFALFVGPTAGFVAGRAAGQPTTTDIAAGRGGDHVTVESSGPPPTLEPGAAGSGDGALVAGGGSTGILRYSDDGLTEPLAKSFEREIGDITIHVYRAALDSPTPDVEGPDWWERPASCSPNGYVQADVAMADAVGIVVGSAFPEVPDGNVFGTVSAVGVDEGAPYWVVIAQGPSGTARVRASFPDGQSDEMEPIDGIVVLIAPASIEPGDQEQFQTTVPLEAFDDEGSSIGSGTAQFGLSLYGGDVLALAGGSGVALQGEECFRPTELPPPGDEQPADPAAARAGIEGLFGQRMGDRTVDDLVADIDDPTGMAEVYEQLGTGGFAQAALSARTMLKDVVFLSATRAAVQYDVEMDGYPPGAFDNEFGEVVLVDGQWKWTRASVCGEVRNAGITCPPAG
jgi:hypothetical protein